jgi:hypothetical protein
VTRAAFVRDYELSGPRHKVDGDAAEVAAAAYEAKSLVGTGQSFQAVSAQARRRWVGWPNSLDGSCLTGLHPIGAGTGVVAVEGIR